MMYQNPQRVITMNLPRKRPKFVAGELLEIPLGSHGFGCAQVIQRADFGALLAIFELITAERIVPDVVAWQEFRILDKAYVNTSSARRKWNSLGVVPLGADVVELPVFFYGSSASGWTMQQADGAQQHLSGQSANRRDFLTRGYVHKVLWLAEDIELLISQGQVLSWPEPD
jgi:hypothetical protein